MYRITGIIHKQGGSPVFWTYYSRRRMTREQCETMLSRGREVGKCYGFRVTLTDFRCEKVTPKETARIVAPTKKVSTPGEHESR